MLNEKLAWKEESDECKKIRSIFNFAWSFLKCKRLSLYYSTFEASMMIFIMATSSPNLCIVLQIMQENFNDFCFQSFTEVTQRTLSNLQVKKAD